MRILAFDSCAQSALRKAHTVEHQTWTANLEYAPLLGALFANLGSLDLALRHAIYLHETQPEARVRSVSAWWASLREEQVHAKNHLTSWDSLRELVGAYNSYSPTLRIDEGIADLRDALAHGRILATGPASDLTLIRFSNPRQTTTVTVEKVERLTPDWLRQQIHRVNVAVVRVRNRIRELSTDDKPS